MTRVPGQSVTRHCAGSLTAVGNAAASIRAGMDAAICAGGTHSYSMNPTLSSRVPGQDEPVVGMRPTVPYYDGANDDFTLSVGWNVANEAGITRAEMDAWAFRSHQRAVAAIDAGQFNDEIVPVPVTLDGKSFDFAVDAHPRRNSSLAKLGTPRPLPPAIDGLSIPTGTASGCHDPAHPLALLTAALCRAPAQP